MTPELKILLIAIEKPWSMFQFVLFAGARNIKTIVVIIVIIVIIAIIVIIIV